MGQALVHCAHTGSFEDLSIGTLAFWLHVFQTQFDSLNECWNMMQQLRLMSFLGTWKLKYLAISELDIFSPPKLIFYLG